MVGQLAQWARVMMILIPAILGLVALGVLTVCLAALTLFVALVSIMGLL